MNQQTPKGFRLHIGLFGRRNSGKSSLLNAITRQNVSIVSEFAGTTTDPVEKPMELLPLGPVLFIDTAGIDDEGAIGELRVKRTLQVIDRTDLGVIVSDGGRWGKFEDAMLTHLTSRDIPVVVVFNKIDQRAPDPEIENLLRSKNVPVVRTAAILGTGILDFRQALLMSAPAEFLKTGHILADIVGSGEMAVLVVPIDKEAPKGRLILPQVQAIRDLLDGNAYCVVVKDDQLRDALARLKRPPALVVTDSQAFEKVAAETPRTIRLTSFSILFARFKGDLDEMVRGALAVEQFRDGDKILIAEACTHHPIQDDIGRVKIPRWLREYTQKDLRFESVQGHDFSETLPSYRLVIHCGACMLNRREMLNRILHCRRVGVPITNYGVIIAYSLGILERALEPFPKAFQMYRELSMHVTASAA